MESFDWNQLHEHARITAKKGLKRILTWQQQVFAPTVKSHDFSARHIIDWLDDPSIGHEMFTNGKTLIGPNIHYPSRLDELYHDGAHTLIAQMYKSKYIPNPFWERFKLTFNSLFMSWATIPSCKDPLRVAYGIIDMATHIPVLPDLLSLTLAHRDFPKILEPKLLELMKKNQGDGFITIWNSILYTSALPNLSVEDFNDMYFRPFPGSVPAQDYAERIGREGVLWHIKHTYNNPARRRHLPQRIGRFIIEHTARSTPFDTIWRDIAQCFETGYAGAIDTANGNKEICPSYPGVYDCILRSRIHEFGTQHCWSATSLKTISDSIRFQIHSC